MVYVAVVRSTPSELGERSLCRYKIKFHSSIWSQKDLTSQGTSQGSRLKSFWLQIEWDGPRGTMTAQVQAAILGPKPVHSRRSDEAILMRSVGPMRFI